MWPFFPKTGNPFIEILLDLQTITTGNLLELDTTIGAINSELLQGSADLTGRWALFIAKKGSQLDWRKRLAGGQQPKIIGCRRGVAF